jgi:hypothetical protein
MNDAHARSRVESLAIVRIVFFSHNFFPEGNAPATRTYDHCVRWVRAGHQVTVITGVPNVPNGIVYDGYRNRWWPQRETIDGVHVIRVWTYVTANAGGAKRILNFLSYMASAVLAFAFCCRRPHLVIATSPQFFCGWAGVLASWVKWCPFLLEVRDIWPESIVTVGAMRKGWVTRILEAMEKWMYLSASHVVTVGEGYKLRILARAKVDDRISVITNGVDLEQYRPQPPSPEFLARWNLAGRFVCSYVGTVGMAHGLGVIPRAAQRLWERGRRDICFCVVGDGAERENLERQSRQLVISDLIRFTGRLPKSDMSTVLASSNCLLIHLKNCELFETVIPSKIFESMAMERPLIMGVRGEAAEIVRRSGSGVEIEPDNAEQLADVVCRLKDDLVYYQTLCRGARRFVAQHYSRDALAARYLTIMMSLVTSRT